MFQPPHVGFCGLARAIGVEQSTSRLGWSSVVWFSRGGNLIRGASEHLPYTSGIECQLHEAKGGTTNALNGQRRGRGRQFEDFGDDPTTGHTYMLNATVAHWIQWEKISRAITTTNDDLVNNKSALSDHRVLHHLLVGLGPHAVAKGQRPSLVGSEQSFEHKARQIPNFFVVKTVRLFLFHLLLNSLLRCPIGGRT